MTADVSRKGSMIVLGDDEVRIEEGPALKVATATEELLHDDNTAAHYYTGVRNETYYDDAGKPYSVPKIGMDAKGKPIKLGEEMYYLAHGGNKTPTERVFYIYRKRTIDPTNPILDNGDVNPHYVPENVRNGETLAKDGTPPNRTHYTYIFDEVATRKTESAAIEYGQSLLAKGAK